jgi:hypothetical protein
VATVEELDDDPTTGRFDELLAAVQLPGPRGLRVLLVLGRYAIYPEAMAVVQG